MATKQHRLVQIETLEQSVFASKIISEAVFEGDLDRFGVGAEITPIELEMDDDDRCVAITYVAHPSTEFADQIVGGPSNVVELHPWAGQKFSLPVPA